MLLERIEIDTRGPLGLVQLGPFSPRLNAILGPVTHAPVSRAAAADGSSALPVVPFLRALMLGSRASQAVVGGSSGRVVWADAEGLLHCRRELDGTLQGRLAVDFEPREPAASHVQAGPHRSDYLRRRLSQLPPSIIEAVIAETSHSGSVFSAIRAASLVGLDQVTESATLQADQRRERERLHVQLAQLQQRIDSISVGDQSMLQLSDRRDQLQAELDSLENLVQSAREQRSAEKTLRRGREHRLLELHEETRRLSEQESELRRNLTAIEADLRTLTFDSITDHPRVAVAETHRRQLEDLDGQLIRWRRMLAEVRGMREQLGHWALANDASDAAPQSPSSEDWDARLDAAHRHIDWLTVRYAYGDPLSDEPTAVPDETLAADGAACHANDLIEQLHAIKAELGQLCARLAHDAASGSYWSQESARAQLQRCESELLDSIARLVRQRHRLLRRISQAHQVPPEQLATAFGDWSHCQDHPHLYQWLLSEGNTPQIESRQANQARARRLESDRAACSHELDRTVNRLENCLAEIEVLRRQRQQLTDELHWWPTQRREAILAELASVRARLEDLETRQHLVVQRDQCRHQIAQIRPVVRHESTLARRASHWLTQLSGGRMRSIQWQKDAAVGADAPAHDLRRGDVRVDGRDAAQWTAGEHVLASLAVRMAVADALAHRGQSIPLLVEYPTAAGSLIAQPLNHGDAWDVSDDALTSQRWDTNGSLPPWIDTLIGYAESGRQTILLTADRRVADRIANAGGRVQSLTAHAYAVPRSVYTYRSAPQRERRLGSLPQINRDLDMAWREAYGFYDDPAWDRGIDRQGTAPVAYDHREDYRDGDYLRSGAAALRPYLPPSVFTDLPGSMAPLRHVPSAVEAAGLPDPDERSEPTAASPFFLTTDSPVDQAPSVDALVAARLRTVRVTRVGHLLAADPLRLAETLGMPDVSAAVVRRWQHEARLVCQVPQLRGFDARLLVGCGIADPQQLAAMHPGQLLEKVEAFLATDRGRQVLRSGSSYELSRITSWIAAANRSVARSNRHGQRPVASTDAVSRPAAESQTGVDQDSGGRTTAKHRRRRRAADASSGERRRTLVAIANTEAEDAVDTDRDFYLDLQRPVVEAPSIGPRTANRLQRIGIHTVDDLLQEDPALVAGRLGSKRIDAKCVRQWQQQATLVCCVPKLRGFEAALLVAAGIHQPERLAGWDADRLLAKIRKLTVTAEGKRLLRGAREPDAQRIASWIRHAQHHRTLRAA